MYDKEHVLEQTLTMRQGWILALQTQSLSKEDEEPIALSVTAPSTRRDIRIAMKWKRPGMLKLGVIMPHDGVSPYAVRPSGTPTIHGLEGTVPSP